MIIQNQTNANQNVNQASTNNGVTFTDKPVESQAPASASVSEQSAASVSAKASVAQSEAASLYQ